jgi:hypothetical protein
MNYIDLVPGCRPRIKLGASQIMARVGDVWLQVAVPSEGSGNL